jgi:hypothetical protein
VEQSLARHAAEVAATPALVAQTHLVRMIGGAELKEGRGFAELV